MARLLRRRWPGAWAPVIVDDVVVALRARDPLRVFVWCEDGSAPLPGARGWQRVCVMTGSADDVVVRRVAVALRRSARVEYDPNVIVGRPGNVPVAGRFRW